MQTEDNYQHPHHEWSSENEVGEFLASLIRMTKAKKVIEVGVFHGVTSIPMIEATPINGQFIGIDIDDLRNDEAKYAYNVPKATFIQGDSVAALKSLADQKFDILFIDSMHHWSHILPEWKEVENHVADGGIIAYHDSLHIEDVVKLMDYAQKWNYSRIDMQTPGGRGLTLLQKKKK